jgi:hypothetical protein
MSDNSEELKIWLINNSSGVYRKCVTAANYISELEVNNKVLEDALKMLWNDVGGGKKKCGHDFCCSCAGDNAKKVLNRLTTNRGEE